MQTGEVITEGPRKKTEPGGAAEGADNTVAKSAAACSGGPACNDKEEQQGEVKVALTKEERLLRFEEWKD